jgi:hypothetical protein
MWIHPINSESLGRNKAKTRNQKGIPCVSVHVGIGMYWLPAQSVQSPPYGGNYRISIPVAARLANYGVMQVQPLIP